MRIKDFAKQDRPREKALKEGIESLSDAELISVLLRSGYKDKSAIEIGYEIIKCCNGISGLKDTSISDLKKIKGIGDVKTLTIFACKEFAKRYYYQNSNTLLIRNCDQINDIFQPLLANEIQEYFYVLTLDIKHCLINKHCLYKGGLNTNIIHPRDIFRVAIKDNAATIILVHNHPSGDSCPSTNDINTTLEINKLSKEIGIPLIDHIIIGKGKYTSLKQNKLF